MKLLPNLGQLLVNYWCRKKSISMVMKSSLHLELYCNSMLGRTVQEKTFYFLLCHLATKSFKGTVHLRRYKYNI